MDEFCGSSFWLTNLTWTTQSNPDFSPCFQETILAWFPCVIFWLFLPFDLINIYISERRYIPVSKLNSFKIFLTFALCILSFSEYIEAAFSEANLSLVHYATPIIKSSTYILVFILLIINRNRGVHTSTLLFVFWLLTFLVSVINVRSLILSWLFTSNEFPTADWKLSEYVFTERILTPMIVFVQLILSCIADRKAQDPFQIISEDNGCPSPEEEASVLSKLTYFWMYPLLWRGFKKPLTQHDLYSIRRTFKSDVIAQKFDSFLDPQINKALVEKQAIGFRKNDKQGRENEKSIFLIPRLKSSASSENNDVPTNYVGILGVILKNFWPTLFLSFFFKFLVTVFMFASPMLLDRIITFVNNKEPSWRGLLYASSLFIVSLVNSLLSNKQEYLSTINVMLINTSLTSAIYKKTIRLSNQGRKNYSTGQIVNLMAVDTQRISEVVQNINNLFSAPLQLVLAMLLLYQQLGYAIFAGLGVMAINSPLNAWVMHKTRDLQVKVMKFKDQRIKLLSELFNGIKIVKIHAWETAFRDRIESIRNEEIKALTRQTWYAAGMTFSFACLPFAVALASFAAYVLLDDNNILDANKVFVSLSLFNIIRIPLAILPMILNNLSISLESVRRINKYLETEEVDPDMVKQINDQGLACKVENATFKWTNDGVDILKNIDIRVPKGKLLAIVGEVGSGKSSLIAAMLGNMVKIDGQIYMDLNSSVAYVPQEAWILDSSLKENILLNKVLNEERYQRILDACALRPDLEILVDGDKSNATNLSGGQKQRVSIARAVYADSDIYFLDDPFSAVDNQTGNHIFEKIIGSNGMLKHRTRVLSTNKLSILPHVDYILIMKDGKIDECGTYKELLKKKGALSDLLVKYLLDKSSQYGIDINSSDKILKSTTRPDLIMEELRRIESFKKDEETKRKDQVKEVEDQVHKSTMKPNQPKQSKPSEFKNEEVSQVGSVGLEVHMNFIRTLGFLFVLAQSIHIMSAVFQLGSNIWLSEWSNDATNATLKNDTKLRDYRLGVYAGLGIADSLCVIFSTVLANLSCLQASKVLHDRILKRVLNAPLSWFNINPTGRILNRFSKDIDTVDVTIRFNVRILSIIVIRTVVSLILISIGSPFSIIPLIPIVCLYILFQIFYVSTSRQLKRIESATKSPVYSHFSETILGRQSIRAFKIMSEFTLESNHRVDVNNMSYYTACVASRWLSVRLEFLGFIVVLSASMVAVLLRDTISPGIAGLSVTYSLTITMVMSMLVRTYSDYETNVVSVERILEYTRLTTEPEDDEEPVDPNWPSSGQIVFEDYSTRYRPDLDLVLKDLNIEIKPSEKIGIVGRTGSGKSSITLALFRVLEPTGGLIEIDGVNISRIDLKILRSRLSIIPQEPILFTGTIRFNVDPTMKKSDEEIWRAIDLAHLGEFVRNLDDKLEHEVNEGGSNFSTGQKQLFCLARSLLRRSKILILDEATASVDVKTDGLIQETIRKEFANSTMLTIAHRVETVQDYDRILVMDNGRAEFEQS